MTTPTCLECNEPAEPFHECGTVKAFDAHLPRVRRFAADPDGNVEYTTDDGTTHTGYVDHGRIRTARNA